MPCDLVDSILNMPLLFLAAAALLAAPPRPTPEHLTLALVLPTGPGQQKAMGKHWEAINQFLDNLLHPGDSVFVVTIEKDVKLVRPATESRLELDRALGAAIYGHPYGKTLADTCHSRSKCQTSSKEAISATARQFQLNDGGRKVIVVFGESTGKQSDSGVQVFSVVFPLQAKELSEKLAHLKQKITQTE